jgi:hypothetical protein
MLRTRQLNVSSANGRLFFVIHDQFTRVHLAGSGSRDEWPKVVAALTKAIAERAAGATQSDSG